MRERPRSLRTETLVCSSSLIDLPGNFEFGDFPKTMQEQKMSRAGTFMLPSLCGWSVTLDGHKTGLWEAEEVGVQSCQG